jgi:hypothetical protein
MDNVPPRLFGLPRGFHDIHHDKGINRPTA